MSVKFRQNVSTELAKTLKEYQKVCFVTHEVLKMSNLFLLSLGEALAASGDFFKVLRREERLGEVRSIQLRY